MTHPAWEGRIALSTGPHQARTHLSQALTGFLSHSVQPKPTLGRQKNGGPEREGHVQGYRARNGAQAFPGGAFSCMPRRSAPWCPSPSAALMTPKALRSHAQSEAPYSLQLILYKGTRTGRWVAVAILGTYLVTLGSSGAQFHHH